MAEGRVVYVSPNGGMLVVANDDGFTVVEMLGDEGALSIGDEVFGDWTALGGEEIRSDGATYEAVFQGTWPSLRAAASIANR